MSVFETMSFVGGIGLLAGIRLYLTVFCLGLAIRFGWMNLADNFSDLRFLGDPLILGISGVCLLAEFFADKIPWVDSAWDSIHTFIRPLAAAFVAYSATGQETGAVQLSASLLAGTFAFSSHTAKAATRLAVNHSPEPFSNMALSLAGDVAVPAALWFTFEHPEVMLGIGIALAITIAILWPKLYRLLRVEVKALRALIASWSGDQKHALDPLPDHFASKLKTDKGAHAAQHGLPVVCAGGGLRGLQHSIGYLVYSDKALLFVTRRWGLTRVVELPRSADFSATWHKRWLLDAMEIVSEGRTYRFDVFKDAAPAAKSFATHVDTPALAQAAAGAM